MRTILVLLAALAVFGTNAMADNYVCLYALANYQGGKHCFAPGQKPSNLDIFPLSDGSYVHGHYGSILIIGSAVGTIYEGSGFHSSIPPMRVDASIPDLSEGWPTTILSLVVTQ